MLKLKSEGRKGKVGSLLQTGLKEPQRKRAGFLTVPQTEERKSCRSRGVTSQIPGGNEDSAHPPDFICEDPECSEVETLGQWGLGAQKLGLLRPTHFWLLGNSRFEGSQANQAHSPEVFLLFSNA